MTKTKLIHLQVHPVVRNERIVSVTLTICHYVYLFTGVEPGRRTLLSFAAVITIICSLLRLLFEKLLQLFKLKQLCNSNAWRNLACTHWEFFKSPINYMEVVMYILSIVFVSVSQNECLCPTRGQWQAGIIAVFFAWFDLLFFLNKWPLIGIYIEMWRRIILNFLKIAILAVFLIFAFGITFYLTFHEPHVQVICS